MPLILQSNTTYKEPSNLEKVAELGVWGLTGMVVHTFAQGIAQRPILASNFN